MSSGNANIAASNSLILSGLKFGDFIFNEKYSKNMDKFTTTGLSSDIYFRGALLFEKEEKSKQEKHVSIGSINVDVHERSFQRNLHRARSIILILVWSW